MMMIIIKHYLLIAIMIFLIGCSDSSSHKNATKDNSQKEIAKNEPSTLPTMTPVKGVLQHTIYVGTSDRPTLDGGIINAADGILVNHEQPLSVDISHTTPQNIQPSSIKTASDQKSTETKIFHDKWATSQKVKQLLEEAVQNGKLEYVLKKSDELGLPASVATVPMVESHYQNKALSLKGAAGAWQLMPAVAKDYGIKNEQRLEFEASTNTALKLLNNLHQQFGSWELAFAAYNAGATKVQTALQKNPKAESIEQLELPQETKDYVNHIMSLNKAIVSFQNE
jgi:hypothetical protein